MSQLIPHVHLIEEFRHFAVAKIDDCPKFPHQLESSVILAEMLKLDSFCPNFFLFEAPALKFNLQLASTIECIDPN